MPLLWQCDETKDCEDGSDEHFCVTKTCGSGKFECKSGMCIPGQWECDGDIDCVDGTDEHAKCGKFFQKNVFVKVFMLIW